MLFIIYKRSAATPAYLHVAYSRYCLLIRLHCQSTAASASPVEHRPGAGCTGFHVVAKNTALYYRRGLYYRRIPRGLYYRQPCDNAIVFLPPYTKLEGTLPLRRVFPGTRSSYCMEHIRFNFPETCLLSLVASCRCTSYPSWTR